MLPSDCAPPAYLGATAQSRWRDLATELSAQNVDLGLVRDYMVRYCDAYAEWLESAQKVRDQGMVVKDGAGRIVQSPYAAARDAAADEMHRCMTEMLKRQNPTLALWQQDARAHG